jgi:hypothetical protein
VSGHQVGEPALVQAIEHPLPLTTFACLSDGMLAWQTARLLTREVATTTGPRMFFRSSWLK